MLRGRLAIPRNAKTADTGTSVQIQPDTGIGMHWGDARIAEPQVQGGASRRD